MQAGGPALRATLTVLLCTQFCIAWDAELTEKLLGEQNREAAEAAALEARVEGFNDARPQDLPDGVIHENERKRREPKDSLCGIECRHGAPFETE